MTATESDLSPTNAHQMRAERRAQAAIAQHVVAVIAYELQTPVAGITSAAQLLRYRVSEDPLIEKNVGRILRDAERLNALVSALLEYSRPAPVTLAPADPNAAWTEVLAAHRGLLESKALLVHHQPADPPAICDIDAEQLGQTFAHLLANAMDAAPEGSDLTIVSAMLGDGSWQTRLHNDGAPISAEILARAFDPLVTTKAGHAGLGLAVAQRIVSEHGGTITLERGAEGGVNAGTTAVITLPASRLP